MLEKITRVYANHGMPIECDIYTVAEPVPDAPVALFFHAGALTGWGRDCVPPWLVQVRLFFQRERGRTTLLDSRFDGWRLCAFFT